MTAPSYIGNGGVVFANVASSINVPYPAVAAGDIAVILMAAFNAASTSIPSTPSGWNSMRQQFLGNSEVAYDSYCFWKRLTGSETGTQAAGQMLNANTLGGIMMIFRGCLASGTPFEALTSRSSSTGPKLGSAMTTTGVDRLGVNMYIQDEGAGNATTPGSGWAQAFGVFQGGLATQAFSLATDTKTQATAGTLAAESTTGTVPDRWASISFALIPGSPVYSDSVSETGTALDTSSDVAVLPTTIAEAVTAVDTVTTAGGYGASVSETASAADTVNATGPYRVTLAEATVAVDTVSLGAPIYGASISETTAALDTVGFLSPYHEFIVETASAEDTVSMIGHRKGAWFLSFARVVPPPSGQGPGNPGVLFGDFFDQEF